MPRPLADGLYAFTVDVGGRPVVARARVRDGCFQGLGDFAHLRGVLVTAPSVASAIDLRRGPAADEDA